MKGAAPLTHWEDAPVEQWRERWQLPGLRVFAEVPSTNDVVRAAGAAGEPAGSTAIAEYQTAGRGRLGRSWLARPGQALLLSTLLRPAGGPPETSSVLPLRVGLAIADALQELTGRTPQLKWPNDVQYHGRKVAGILCEAAADYVVVGMGINVAQQSDDFDPELQPLATSVLLATGLAPARPALAGAILNALRPLFTAPHRPLDEGELARFAALDVLASKPITLDDAPAGIAIGVTATGALLVDDGGERRLIHAGTVRSTA